MEESQLHTDTLAEINNRTEEPDNIESLAKDFGIANISEELIGRYRIAVDSGHDQSASVVSSTLFDQAHRAINIVKHNMGATVFPQKPPFPKSVGFYHNKYAGRNGGVSPIIDGKPKGIVNGRTSFPKNVEWGRIDYSTGNGDDETITLQVCDKKVWRRLELIKQGSSVAASYKEAPDPE